MAGKTIVVGSGINGASAAYFLVEAGMEVVLVERDFPASGPTGSSSALTHAFYLEPELSQLAHRGTQLLRSLHNITGGPNVYSEVGMMWVVGAEAAGEWMTAVERIKEEGAKIDILDVDAVAADAPGFDFDQVAMCVWEPEGGYADPATATSSLAHAARAHGAILKTNTSVASLIYEGDRVQGVVTADSERIEADSVVVAAGPWTRNLVRQVGVDLPLTVERHPMAVIDAPGAAQKILPWSWCDDILGNYARPEGKDLVFAGQWAGGGTAHRKSNADRGREVDMDTMSFTRTVGSEESAEIVASFEARIPSFAASKLRPGYADLYDMSPDDLPVIGAIPGVEGLFVIAGSSGHGFKTGPAVGEAVAQLVTSGESALLGPFSPTRFLHP